MTLLLSSHVYNLLMTLQDCLTNSLSKQSHEQPSYKQIKPVDKNCENWVTLSPRRAGRVPFTDKNEWIGRIRFKNVNNQILTLSTQVIDWFAGRWLEWCFYCRSHPGTQYRQRELSYWDLWRAGDISTELFHPRVPSSEMSKKEQGLNSWE